MGLEIRKNQSPEGQEPTNASDVSPVEREVIPRLDEAVMVTRAALLNIYYDAEFSGMIHALTRIHVSEGVAYQIAWHLVDELRANPEVAKMTMQSIMDRVTGTNLDLDYGLTP